jgi:hypothetical protein
LSRFEGYIHEEGDREKVVDVTTHVLARFIIHSSTVLVLHFIITLCCFLDARVYTSLARR